MADDNTPTTELGDSSNPGGLDPQDFPPHSMNPAELQAAHGRLADVDPDYAPDGSDQEGAAKARPEFSEDQVGLAELAEQGRQANREAGAAGAGDDLDPSGRTDLNEAGIPTPEPVLPAGDPREEEDVVAASASAEAESAREEAGAAQAEGQGDVAVEPEPEPEVASEAAGDADDPNNLTVAELQAELDGKGVEYDKYARKAELVELVRANR
jgi:HeH/LEM domain